MNLLLFLGLNIVFLAAAVVFLLFLIHTLIIAAYRGSPYAPTKASRMAAVFAFAQSHPGDLLVDLGSGNGGVLIEAARRGIRARGVEINPFWVWYSRLRIRWHGLSHLAAVVRGDMFVHPIPDADIIFLFLVPGAMARLSGRLRHEAKQGTRIIANRFALPGWTPHKEQDMMLLYYV